ncbi:hypothetical protein E2562_034909 [Oryza meyeriana var. granulata]|uniref:Ubiquitin-like domain-containing protein n=1 Tax=Oryza meyeriana var. granulata TaxID=110450 RepID=A0A6G1F1F7_9ORYZ|nr:hypothetical protein E2562_034909 [Oryza meyeriana var. granulata]
MVFLRSPDGRTHHFDLDPSTATLADLAASASRVCGGVPPQHLRLYLSHRRLLPAEPSPRLASLQVSASPRCSSTSPCSEG